MTTPTRTNVEKVKLNIMHSSDYQALVNAGQVSSNELYMTIDEVYATQQWVLSQGYTDNVGTVTKVNNTSPDSNGNVTITIPDPLPSQSGQNGKYLTTNGTTTSWGAINAGIFYWGE